MMNELVEPTRDREFTTKEVLREIKNERIFYYLPCYVRLKVKEILHVDFA